MARRSKAAGQRLTFLVGVGGAVALLAWWALRHRQAPAPAALPAAQDRGELVTCTRGDGTTVSGFRRALGRP